MNKYTDFKYRDNEKLAQYANELFEYNKKVNLTAVRDIDLIWQKHFYDSYVVLEQISIKNKKVVDIGTGAGFPGLVWKIIEPTIDLTLIESSKKKCDFLKYIVDKLSLDNVKILNLRVEDATEIHNKFDIVTTRAMSQLNILVELSIPLLKIGGQFIGLKAELIDEEKHDGIRALKKIDTGVYSIIDYAYIINNEIFKRNLFIATKTQNHDIIFPRKYSQIKKKPL